MPELSAPEWFVLAAIAVLACVSTGSTLSMAWLKADLARSDDAELIDAARQTSWPQVGIWAVSTALLFLTLHQIVQPEGEPFAPWLGALLLDQFANRLHARDGVLQDQPGEIPWNALEGATSLATGAALLWLRGLG
jgi:hypothetical protein